MFLKILQHFYRLCWYSVQVEFYVSFRRIVWKMVSHHQAYQSRPSVISGIHLQDATRTRVRYSQTKENAMTDRTLCHPCGVAGGACMNLLYRAVHIQTHNITSNIILKCDVMKSPSRISDTFLVFRWSRVQISSSKPTIRV